MKSRRDSAGQLAFALSGSADDASAPAEPLADYLADIAERWGLPVGLRARVTLKDHAVDEAAGKLVLVEAPEPTARATDALTLRIGSVVFRSSQVVAWSLIDPPPDAAAR